MSVFFSKKTQQGVYAAEEAKENIGYRSIYQGHRKRISSHRRPSR